MANRAAASRPSRRDRTDAGVCVTPAALPGPEAVEIPAVPVDLAAPAAGGAGSGGSEGLLSDRLRAELGAYLALAAGVLRLDGWTVTVAAEPADDDAVAQIDAPWAQRRAVVRIGAEFWRSGPEDQRDALVHELLHLVVMPAWQLIDELLDDELSARAARVAWLGFTQHMEYSIDQLAAVIGPQLPLPSFVPDPSAESRV
jgi:hypothetical protein